MQIEGYRDRVKQFYDFMLERELIRQRRRAGLDMSMWTADPIFQTYSFTNVKRDHDRTTVLLKEIYDTEKNKMEGYHLDGLSRKELKTLLLNCAIYRFFGTVESARTIGWLEQWDDDARARVMRLGPLLRFTSAYIVTSAGRSDSKYVVVCEFIDSIWSHADEILNCTAWESAVSEMTQCYGVGSFMAKEIYLDFILASGRVPTDWKTWTPVGPGGRRGASRIRYNVPDKISEREALDIIRDVYALRDEYWPETLLPMMELSDQNLQGQFYNLPRLDLTDIQFQFCERDKYLRVAEGRRPKRFFRPTIDEVTEPRLFK